MLGIGVDKDQVSNLLLDFVNLFCVSMYILTFRNPILVKRMTKVFWQFPSPEDIKQWKRLNREVQKQVKWLFSAKKLTDEDKYAKAGSNYPDTTLNTRQVKMAGPLLDFANEYKQQNEIGLNDVLTNYVDLQYEQIWSHDFMKEKKQEFKDNNSYYRLVKQGSQLVYVSFHIFTIFIVMLMATMRQSIIALGYVLILIPRIKDGAEVLNQRDIEQNKEKAKL